jgi:serine/threonine protein kinase
MKATNASGPPRLVPGLDVRAGQTLAGRYRVEERLGTGPAGVVLSARHIHLQKEVTLKVLFGRSVAEARRAAGLASPHVARIIDVGMTEHGMPYVATERLSGHTLEQELDARGRLPLEEAVRWILEACEGLAEAHALGFVHGDLKPSNLFLADARAAMNERQKMRALAQGVDPRSVRTLKVLDFGMTKPLDDASTAFIGTPAYLAPEQIQDAGSIDARADVWALGVILYELLSEKLPFVADTLSGVLVAVCVDAPAMLTDAPYDLAKIVHRCLEKDPARRPRDVSELARALQPFAGAEAAELCDRVSTALSSPPPDDTGSISPISLDLANERESADTFPLVTQRDAATAPSRRVVRRRRLSRTAAYTMFAASAAIAIATWRELRTEVATAAERVGISRDSIERAMGSTVPQAPPEVEATAPVEPTTPPPTPVPDTQPEEAAQPVEHQAPVEPPPKSVEPPKSSDPPKHVPRAMTPIPRPVSRVAVAPTSHLPVGLPATREPVLHKGHDPFGDRK